MKLAVICFLTLTVCLLAQRVPSLPPLPKASYPDAACSIRAQTVSCEYCKRGSTMVQLIEYKFISDVITDGKDKPRVNVEKFTWLCHICNTIWRKNIIVK